MTKQERIIAAYNCVNDKLPDRRCENCPYSYGYLDQRGDNYFVSCNEEMIMADAITLIYAQIPRVMTLEEAAALPGGSVVWLEDNDKQDVIAGMLRDVYISTKENDTVVVLFHFVVVRKSLVEIVTAMAEDYEIRWRCWSKEPTYEQREMIPWMT